MHNLWAILAFHVIAPEMKNINQKNRIEFAF